MNANGIVFYVTLTNCVITDNPSWREVESASCLRVGDVRRQPCIDNRVPIREVVYTNEGSWGLINDNSGECYWVLELFSRLC